MFCAVGGFSGLRFWRRTSTPAQVRPSHHAQSTACTDLLVRQYVLQPLSCPLSGGDDYESRTRGVRDQLACCDSDLGYTSFCSLFRSRGALVLRHRRATFPESTLFYDASAIATGVLNERRSFGSELIAKTRLLRSVLSGIPI